MTERARTVTTGATGRAEHDPETATVKVGATGRGSTPRRARETAAERAAAVREALADVAHDRVRTTDFRSGETQQRQPEQPPYEATELLAVDTAPESADAVVVAATEAGATVNGVDFSLTEPTRRDVRAGALSDAMVSARRQAETLAAAEGLAVGGAVEVTASELRSRRGTPMGAESGPATGFRPGPVAVTADVEVCFELVER
jgi:hypothetical protein